MNRRTHYEILQVSSKASSAVIEVAWKVLMRQHHPDRGGDSDVARRINEAHDVLSDPDKRKLYDLELEQAKTVRMPGRVKPGQRRAYPDAYPPAYPSAYPSGEFLTEAFEEFEKDLMAAAFRAGMDILERSDPIFKTLFQRVKKRA